MLGRFTVQFVLFCLSKKWMHPEHDSWTFSMPLVVAFTSSNLGDSFYFRWRYFASQSINAVMLQNPWRLAEGFHCVVIYNVADAQRIPFADDAGFHVSSWFRNKSQSCFVRYWNPIGFYNKWNGFRGRRWLPKLVALRWQAWSACSGTCDGLQHRARVAIPAWFVQQIHILQFRKLSRW